MNNRWTTLFSGNNGLNDGYNKKQILKKSVSHFILAPLGKIISCRLCLCTEHLAAVLTFLTDYHNDPSILTRIVTSDEMWIHYLTLSTKKQTITWKQADEPAPKKVKLEKSQKRLVCTSFWDYQGVIYIEYQRVDRKEGYTATKERYIETLYNLCNAIKCKHLRFSRPESLFFRTTPGHTLPESPSLSSLILAELFSHICHIVPIWHHLITSCSLCWK